MRWDMLDRYNAGECEPAERDEVERWLAEEPIRRRVLEEMATALSQDNSPGAKAVVRRRLEKEFGRERGTGERQPGDQVKKTTQKRPNMAKKEVVKRAKKKPGKRKRKPR
jgi:ferric-dicitrate binding protein FerR (iron transport regulator)